MWWTLYYLSIVHFVGFSTWHLTPHLTISQHHMFYWLTERATSLDKVIENLWIKCWLLLLYKVGYLCDRQPGSLTFWGQTFYCFIGLTDFERSFHLYSTSMYVFLFFFVSVVWTIQMQWIFRFRYLLMMWGSSVKWHIAC